MDSLEKYINKHRQEFDSESPPSSLWEKIEAQMPDAQIARRKKIVPIWKILSAAASVVLLIGIGWMLGRPSATDSTSALGYVEMVENIDQEYANQLVSFNEQIDKKQNELVQLVSEYQGADQQILASIEKLDQSYHQLKSIFLVSPNKEVLVEKMIENLTLQLNILNHQLNLIKQLKSDSNEIQI